ncbi:hypothetical protein [Parasitella parasitica]|uniref:BSD domain-containing protein n=1 Tax=Parasitella parasitica TaxID=35722 RepID=A0A0B7N1K5_9FUNG|nr:hypothetical protein [Parasitella parasitica]
MLSIRPLETDQSSSISSTPAATASTASSFFGGSFFSSVTSSVNSLSQTIQAKGIPELNKRLSVLQQRAREIPNQIATLQGDLESERALFVQSKRSDEKSGAAHGSRGSDSVAPWEGYQGYEADMKQAILDICKACIGADDERNFLIPPPSDTSFQFDFNAYSQSAQAALKQDKNLAHMRFLLVPQQVAEPTFWKNYFYRVTLAKQAVLSNPPTEPVKSTDQNVLFDFKDEEEEKEDANEVINQEVRVKEDSNKQSAAVAASVDPSPIDTTKTDQQDTYEGMEDWEIELRKAAI